MAHRDAEAGGAGGLEEGNVRLRKAWGQENSPCQALRRSLSRRGEGEKFFRVLAGTKELVITVDRLKPAFGFADPAPAPAGEERKTVKARETIGGALNPRAKIFVPGNQPNERAIPSREEEGKKMTTAKSRAGRPLRPPERFGARSL